MGRNNIKSFSCPKINWEGDIIKDKYNIKVANWNLTNNPLHDEVQFGIHKGSPINPILSRMNLNLVS